MHHFRGRLKDGDATHLDPANVYIDYTHDADGHPNPDWRGYLLIASEGDVAPGASYTLSLADGRSGKLLINEFSPDPSGKFRAHFVGDGPLR